jgi:hypothetical protein
VNKAVGKNGSCSCERAPYGLAAKTRSRTDGRRLFYLFIFFYLKESVVRMPRKDWWDVPGSD